MCDHIELYCKQKHSLLLYGILQSVHLFWIVGADNSYRYLQNTYLHGYRYITTQPYNEMGARCFPFRSMHPNAYKLLEYIQLLLFRNGKTRRRGPAGRGYPITTHTRHVDQTQVGVTWERVSSGKQSNIIEFFFCLCFVCTFCCGGAARFADMHTKYWFL